MCRFWTALVLTCLSATCTAGGGDSIARAVESFLVERSASLAGKVDVEVGPIAENERHAACRRWEAFMPEGARVWGRVSVGVRCTVGANAGLYVTAKVKVIGRYLVAARGLAGGQPLSAEDMKYVDGELTAQPADILLSEQEALGLVTRAFIPADRPLRAAFLRQDVAVTAGEVVKVIARGSGFTVAAEGQAITSGGIGQSVRVKNSSGAVLTATITNKGVVETR